MPASSNTRKAIAGASSLPAETTDKLLVFGTNGRFYTIGVDKLPGGRGHGEPIRLMIDLGNDQELVALFVHEPGRKLLVASARRARLRRAGGRGRGPDPRRQAGAEPGRGRRGGGLRAASRATRSR